MRMVIAHLRGGRRELAGVTARGDRLDYLEKDTTLRTQGVLVAATSLAGRVKSPDSGGERRPANCPR